jgi:uncharacterized CHY-type Zn-finger protein
MSVEEQESDQLFIMKCIVCGKPVEVTATKKAEYEQTQAGPYCMKDWLEKYSG